MDAEVLVGTYEDYVVGYQVVLVSKQYSLEQSFAVRSHSGSVRCLTVNQNGSLALSVGYDEMMNLFSLKKRKLIQTLEGAVNCACFVENSHLICGSEDSNIYIYECKASDINLVKTLKGHKGPITAMSVHPSGKVLLSISKDNTMRTWNLIKGRSAYVTNNVKSQAHLIHWSTTGDEFMIAANNEVYLYNKLGTLENNLKLDKRINSVEFLTGDILVVASDSGQLEFFDLKTSKSSKKVEAHSSRIKSVKCVETNKIDSSKIVTISSDGFIKLWCVDRLSNESTCIEVKELASVDTGARLTCLASATSIKSLQGLD